MRDGIEEAMTHSIRNGIGHWNGNSLSPEPCALCPAELRLHANLTVGAHDAPAISRPDVLDVGMPIEHLDFTPPCDARWGHEDHRPPAEVVALVESCPCVSGHRLWCRGCLNFTLARDIWHCSTCGTISHGQSVKSWEPLR